jgi:hypothetical protein
VIRGAAATASDAMARAAAQAVVEAGASAVDAIIAGFLAASGADAGVLLAPAAALVAGTGVGARAFDGRAAQPGKGAPRPRGYVDPSAIPAAARFPVPRALAMLVLLHTYLGRAKLRELARHGVLAAEKQGAARRADLLRRIGESGVLALRAREVERALLGCGGPVAGGLLTTEDLEDTRPAEVDARAVVLDDGSTVLGVPWETGDALRSSEGIVACDGRGIVAALAYAPAREGIAVDDLELVAGMDAVPVQRGVARVAPGTPLPAPAPIAVVARGGGFWAALALPDQLAANPDHLACLSSGLALEAVLEEIRGRSGSRMIIGAVRDSRDARAIVLP